MKKFLVINGPNLNCLGTREPDIYGHMTLKDIIKYTDDKLKSLNLNVDVEWFQSNIEGEIVGKVQELISGNFDGLVINPGAYSHTSIAILDALKIISIPVTEVHLSNTNTREEFRLQKITAKESNILMEGLGKNAYFFGVYSQLLNQEEDN